MYVCMYVCMYACRGPLWFSNEDLWHALVFKQITLRIIKSFFLNYGSNLITEPKERETYPEHQNENPLYQSTADETLCNPLYYRCGQFVCLFI